MNFVRTEYPYGGINVDLVLYIISWGKFYYAKDEMGLWRITLQTYEELKKRGVKEHGREYPAT